MSAPEKKQEADFTKEVDELIQEYHLSTSSSSVTPETLPVALEKVSLLEKKARNAADLTSTTRLLLLSILLIRTTPSVDQTNWKLLLETMTSLSKKHGQLKMATTRMVQIVMCFLHPPVADPEAERKREEELLAAEQQEVSAEKIADAKKKADAAAKDSKEAQDAKRRQQAEEEREKEKVGAQNALVQTLMDQAKMIGNRGISTEETRLEIVESLRHITEGKIFVEVERARVTLILSQMLYAKGKINEAADALQDLSVETFGSMDRREKTEFILEQMRLNFERKDFARMAIVSKKINTRYLQNNPKTEDLKLRYYDLMIKYSLTQGKWLDISRFYREIYDTSSIQNSEEKAKLALQNSIIFLVLSPFDNEQSDAMARLESQQAGDLEKVPEYKNLLKCFTTQELMRWPGIETLYSPILRQQHHSSKAHNKDDKDADQILRLNVFDTTTKEGQERWEELHKRVVEHNIRVISKYYTKISLPRLAQLLDLTEEESEASLARLVSSSSSTLAKQNSTPSTAETTNGNANGTISTNGVWAKINRPLKEINFEQRKSTQDFLNAWSTDMDKLMSTVEKVTHLVEKEWAIHRAGIRG